jgi:osmoprotectant transport system permease protein
MNKLWELLMIRKEELLELFIQHMNLTSLAVFISLLIGVPIGIAITKNKVASSIVIGIANLMQSIPAIALRAFSVLFWGIGTKPAIVMVVVYALLPIIKNTDAGIMSIDPKTLESAKGIGLSRWQQLFQVQLPMAAPFMMAGIRISAVTAVGSMTIAAFAGAGRLGWFIKAV